MEYQNLCYIFEYADMVRDKIKSKMRYVKLTGEQSLSGKLRSNSKGYKSGKKDPKTGLREQIVFCSSLDFVIAFGCEVQREYIEI